MSQSVSPYLILDDRLQISDHVGFGVVKSGQSVNQQQFVASSPTTSSVNLNCLIPSLGVVIDRNIKLVSQFEITVQTTGGGASVLPLNTNLITYPTNFCYANFPFSQLVNQLSVQINNATVNQNYQDTLAVMLRTIDEEALQRWGDFTPVTPDYYQSTDQAGTLSQFKDIASVPSQAYIPRGSFKIDSLVNTPCDANGVGKAIITVTVCEPFFVAPFLFGDGLDHANAGLTGVSSINFNLNLDTTASRAVRWLNTFGGVTPTNSTVSLSAVNSFKVLMTFLSPQPSQLIPMTSVLPYYEMPVFKTTYTGGLVAGATTPITSVVIAPNSIPDKVFLAVRPAVGSVLADATHNEFYLPISQVNVTWNNNSGLVGTAQAQDLYYMSKKAGIKQDFLQWSGSASGSGTSATSIPLTGGIVALDFCDMIPVMEDYYSSGSLGTWNFSVSVQVKNTTGVNITQPLELLVIFMQSGCFQTTSGVSSQFVGVLSKDIVLSTSQESPMNKTENSRMIGGGVSLGGIFKSLKTIAGSTLGKELMKKGADALAPKLKEQLSQSKNALAGLATKGLEMAGYGRMKPRVKGGAYAM